MFGKKSVDIDGYKKLKFKVGLALSGGGTRGAAHIGVFKAFDELGIKFNCIAGTSAGSIYGAMYAAGISWQQMLDETKKVAKRDIIDNMFILGSNAQNIQNVADRLLQGVTFDALKIPFSCVAVDIVSGEEVVLNSGSVAKAVSASSAVPVLFKPVDFNDMQLVDGGLLNNMPADVCRQMGAEVVIGVDLNHARGKGTQSTKIWDTLFAVWHITTKGTMYKGYHNSDVVIMPELTQYKNTELAFVDDMVEEGYQATLKAYDEIKQILLIK